MRSTSVIFIKIISIVCLMLFFGCKKTPDVVHANLLKEMENKKVENINWANEVVKYKGMTDIARKEYEKSLCGKKVSVDAVVTDVESGIAVSLNIHLTCSYEIINKEKVQGYQTYYDTEFVKVTSDMGLRHYTFILPKSFSNLKKGQRISVEGSVNRVYLEGNSGYASIDLYPAIVVKK